MNDSSQKSDYPPQHDPDAFQPKDKLSTAHKLSGPFGRVLLLASFAFQLCGAPPVRGADNPLECAVFATGGVLDCVSHEAALAAVASLPGATFHWTGPGIVSGANSAIALVNQPGLYTVTATDSVGCESSVSVLAREAFVPAFLPVLPTVPVDFVLSASENSYFDLEVINAPAGVTITNGIYACWCIKYDFPIETNKVYQGTLHYPYSSDVPAHMREFDWARINHILNHRAGASQEDVQDAIWYFSGRPTGEDLVLSDTAQLVVDDALANGQCFAPRSGDRVAVAIDTGADSGIQWLLIEIVLPPVAAIEVTKNCPPGPIMPGETLVFNGTVTNTGSFTLTNVFVVDDQPAPNTWVLGPITLLPGEGTNFIGSYFVPGITFLTTNTLTTLATNTLPLLITNTLTVITTNTVPVLTTNILTTLTTNTVPVVTTNILTILTTNTVPVVTTNTLTFLSTNTVLVITTNLLTTLTTNTVSEFTTNSVLIYTTNLVTVLTTNSVPVYSTNLVAVLSTNSVPVYTTNLVAVLTTNSFPAYTTNLVAVLTTNLVTVNVTNNTTIVTTNATPPFFGTINTVSQEVVDRFIVPGNMDGLSYADQDKGYAATQFYSMRTDDSGTSFFDTITAGTESITDRFDASNRNFDSLTFAAPDLGYGPVIFYFLSHDNAGLSTFGTITPGGVVGVVADLFEVGNSFDSLTFSATDVGYGANLLYYVRHDTAGISTFGTINPALPGTITDRFTVGNDVDALVFTATDVGYGPNRFYYLRHNSAGISTFGAIFVTGLESGTVTDLFNVGTNAHELTFTTTDTGFGPNLFYFLRGGANLLTNEVAIVTTNEVAVVTTNEVAIVTTNEVSVVTTNEVLVVSTNEVLVVSTNEVAVVSTNEVSVVSTNEVSVVSTNTVPVIATNTVFVVTTNTIPDISTNTVTVITTNTVPDISTNTVTVITTNAVPDISTNTVTVITTNAVPDISTNTVTVITTNTLFLVTTNVVPSVATDTLTATGIDTHQGGIVSATASCSVLVQPFQPVIGGLGVPPTHYSGSAFTLSWAIQIGVSYTVQYKDSLNDPAWTDLPNMPVFGAGEVLTITDSTEGQPIRFYRVILTP